MVLIVRITDPPYQQETTIAQQLVPKQHEKGYKATLDGQRVIFHDVAKEAPIGITDQPRLSEKNRGDVYVSPCGGIIDCGNNPDAATQARSDTTMSSVLASVQESVAERHNVTIINRGFPSTLSTEYFTTLTNSVLGAISGSVERAVQIVADEIAKEKQMQRLLQSDDDTGTTQQVAPKPPTFFKPVADSSAKKVALTLSPPVQLKLRTMSAQREKSPQRSPPGRSNSARSSRFTLLAATSESELIPPHGDGVSGLTPRAFIARPPDTTPTAQRRTTLDLAAAAGAKVTSRRQQQLAKRRPTVAMLEQLSAVEDPSAVQAIKGNGWGTELRYFAFNGSSSVLGLPPIPKFEEFIKSFVIDFWIKTDCKMNDGRKTLLHVMEGQRSEVGMNFHIGLNYHTDFDEHIRIFLRDGGNRVMEVLAPLPTGFTSGQEFHHVMIRIKSLESGKVEVAIDGEPNDRLRYVQQEHPVSFNQWPHNRVYLGSYVDDTNMVQQCFRGGICELRFWKGTASTPLQRWPLLGDRNPLGRLPELTKSVPEEHQETLTDLRESIHHPPQVCPYFDGSTVVNLGTLGVFGEFMSNFSVEVRFKTQITGRSMSLIGVTDSQHKMSEFGIVLNAEPVLSRERFRYHEHHVTFFLTDSYGVCCSMLLRGTERNSVVDGDWHTIQWKVVDSESNKFEVKLDGTVQDLLPVCRDGPKTFNPLRDFVCLGGHNMRNWKIRNVFCGHIKSCQVTVRGDAIASLALDEGPGATVCQDSSGHRNHGLIMNPETHETRRHDLLWAPALDNGNKDAKDSALEQVTSTIIMHKNNAVSFAAIRFGGVFDSSGTIQESLIDITTRKPFEVATTTTNLCAMDKHNWGVWKSLPNEVFHATETIAVLRESVQTALRTHDGNGHLLLIIRIGDCYVSLVDLIGPLVPAFATFDCNMMKWKYAIAINGTKGKREQLLNNCVVGLERMLSEVSATPNLTIRLGPSNTPNDNVTAESLIRSLSSSGIPWRLALIVHSLLLNAEYASKLHVFHSCLRVCTEDEAASIAVVNRVIQKASESRAANLIQRNWRGRIARRRVETLENERRLRKQQVEEIMSLRRANPLVQPKKNLRAILITAHEFVSEMLPPILSFNINEIADPLKKQGYAVEHLKNPTRAQINKAIASVEPDSCTFLYISGYGGPIHVRPVPMVPQYRTHLALEEGHKRVTLELEGTMAFKNIAKEYYAAVQEILKNEAAKAAKGKNAKKPNPKGAAAQAQLLRHVEENFRIAKEELIKDENENRTLKLQKEYEAEVQMLTRDIRQVVNAAQDFEDAYRPKKGGAPMHFFLPSDCKAVEPYGLEVFNVDDVVYKALQRQLPPMGFQAVVAIDLVPLTPNASGVAMLASSTGHSFTFPYQPEQRHVLSWHLRKALQGYMPKVPMKSKEQILQGAVETPDTQRDWRSLACYVTGKMLKGCSLPPEPIAQMISREMPYTADLVPIRAVLATTEAKERTRRDLETKRVSANVVFGVDSLKVTNDMTGEFKSFLSCMTINETVNMNTALVSFMNNNHGIDGAKLEAIRQEVDRCAPANSQDVKYTLTLNAQGAMIAFAPPQGPERQKIQQWLNTIASRSIGWKIPTAPFSARKEVDVDKVEFLYTVKMAGNHKKLKQLLKQRYESPLPYPTIRFMNVIVE